MIISETSCDISTCQRVSFGSDFASCTFWVRMFVLTVKSLCMHVSVMSGRKDGSNERTCRRSAVNLQCREARQATGFDTAVLESDRQIPYRHDEAWLVSLYSCWLMWVGRLLCLLDNLPTNQRAVSQVANWSTHRLVCSPKV